MDILCKCIQEAAIRDSANQQLERLFPKANVREHASIISILGADYWSESHVHDGKVLHDLLLPMVQVIGHSVLVNGTMRRIIANELFGQVAVGLDAIDPNLTGGLLMAIFAPSDAKEKKFMTKAWKVFKKCVAKENNLSKFISFCNANEGIFSLDIIVRLISIGEGIGYLYH